MRLCSTTATHAAQVGAEVEREVLHHHRLCPHAHVIGLQEVSAMAAAVQRLGLWRVQARCLQHAAAVPPNHC